MSYPTRSIERDGAEAAVLQAVRELAEANARLRRAEAALSTLSLEVQDLRGEAHRANLQLEDCLETAGAGVRTERYG